MIRVSHIYMALAIFRFIVLAVYITNIWYIAAKKEKKIFTSRSQKHKKKNN